MKYLIVFIVVSSVLAAQFIGTVFAENDDEEETDKLSSDKPNTSEDSKSQPSSDALKPEVVIYINKKLDALLNKNLEKSSGFLANVFNSERKKLSDNKLKAAATEVDEAKLEQAMENFLKFSTKFNDMEEKMKTTMQNLELILEDDNAPVQQKYKALQLLNELKDSESIREAEKNLNKYDRFTKSSQAPATTLKRTSQPSSLPLTDEYRGYFNEIIEILKKNSMYNNSNMQNYLKRLLNNPKQLEKVAAALYELFSDDEYDDDEDVYEIFMNYLM